MKEDTLRRYRLMLRMTQEQLAGKLGVDRMTVLRYENGETRIPVRRGLCRKDAFGKGRDQSAVNNIFSALLPIPNFHFSILSPSQIDFDNGSCAETILTVIIVAE